MKLSRKGKVLLILVYLLGAVNTYNWRMYHPNRFVVPFVRQEDALLCAAFWPLKVPWDIIDRWWIPDPAGTDTINYLDQ